jgi:hypothetical protein
MLFILGFDLMIRLLGQALQPYGVDAFLDLATVGSQTACV